MKVRETSSRSRLLSYPQMMISRLTKAVLPQDSDHVSRSVRLRAHVLQAPFHLKCLSFPSSCCLNLPNYRTVSAGQLKPLGHYCETSPTADGSWLLQMMVLLQIIVLLQIMVLLQMIVLPQIGL